MTPARTLITAATTCGALSLAFAAGASGAPATTCMATPATTEGPFYMPDAPVRARIATPGTRGTPFVLSGVVRDTRCRPVARAIVDVWQADGRGEYDNSGYRLRGKVRTNARGAFTLRTVVPGIYPGRTEHMHVKVGAPGGPVTTTQLFMPGARGNSSDAFFQPSLVIRDLRRGSVPWTGRYAFTVRI
jgi:protocatechuate 3,4-dioxygenase beta subunit